MEKEKKENSKKKVVGVFWDYENCSLNKNSEIDLIIDAVRTFSTEKGSLSLKNFVIFNNFKNMPEPKCEKLCLSGVTLRQTHNNKPQFSDILIINDIWGFVFDVTNENFEPVVILISGDKDFSLTLNGLKQRGVETFVIFPSSHQISPSFKRFNGIDFKEVLKKYGKGINIEQTFGNSDNITNVVIEKNILKTEEIKIEKKIEKEKEEKELEENEELKSYSKKNKNYNELFGSEPDNEANFLKPDPKILNSLKNKQNLSHQQLLNKFFNIKNKICLNKKFKRGYLTFLNLKGKMIISAGGPTFNNNILVSDHQGKLNNQMSGHKKNITQICVSKVDNNIVSSSNDKKVIIWDTAYMGTKKIELNHDSPVLCVKKHGNLIISATEDKDIYIWKKLNSWKLSHKIIFAHKSFINDLEFDYENESGKLRFISVSKDKKVKIWDLIQEKDTVKAKLSKNYLSKISISRVVCTKKYIICGGISNLFIINKTLNSSSTFPNAHKGKILSMSTFQDFLFTSGEDMKIKIWDIQKVGEFQLIQSIKDAHKKYVNSIKFYEKDESLITCSRDGYIFKWN